METRIDICIYFSKSKKKGEKKKLLQLNFIDANQNYLNALDVIAVIIQSLLHSVFMMERSNPNYQVHVTLLKQNKSQVS